MRRGTRARHPWRSLRAKQSWGKCRACPFEAIGVITGRATRPAACKGPCGGLVEGETLNQRVGAPSGVPAFDAAARARAQRKVRSGWRVQMAREVASENLSMTYGLGNSVDGCVLPRD